jgi:hypothetical protein
MLEAAAQRWNRHVRGYDLRQQLSLVSTMRSRLNTRRALPGPLASPRRIALLVLGTLLTAGALYLLLRRRTSQQQDEDAPAARAEQVSHQVVALYRSLEGAMATRGVPRQPGTPPYAHARALIELHHPISREVYELTRVYLEARFGDRRLSEAERRLFARRVRALKQARDPGSTLHSVSTGHA